VTAELVALANKILTREAMTDDEAKLYAAVHVVANAREYGASRVDSRYLDLLDDRVEQSTLAPNVAADAAAVSPDEVAQLRAEIAAFRQVMADAAKAKTAAAPAPAPAPSGPSANEKAMADEIARLRAQLDAKNAPPAPTTGGAS
jgi:hypothetical protein